MHFASFIARAGAGAATVLMDELGKTSVPSDVMHMIEGDADGDAPTWLKWRWAACCATRRWRSGGARDDALGAVVSARGRLLLTRWPRKRSQTRMTFVECLAACASAAPSRC